MGDGKTFITSNDIVLERLAETDSIADASKKVEALVELAAQLLPSSSEVLAQALAAALAIQDEYSRSRALAALASQLPETERFNVLEQALTAATAMEDKSYRSVALAALAPQLPQTEPKLLEQALTAAAAIHDERPRSRALAALAPQLPQTEPKLLEQALTAAIAIQDESYRSVALTAIAPQLPQTERFNVLEQALTAAIAIQDKSSRFKALAAIAPQLPRTEPKLLEQALTAAIQDEWPHFIALAAIAPQFRTEPKLLEQALTAAIAIQDQYYRSIALAAIAPQLPQTEPKLLEQALTAAIAIQDERPRSVALAAIAPQLPQTEPKLLEQALTAAIAIQDESPRSIALAAIAPQLPQTEPKLLEQALTAAIAFQDEEPRSRALAAIAPQLPQTERFNVLKQALTAAIAIQDESPRSIALAAIAPQLPQTEPKLLEQALTAAIAIQDESFRSVALAALAPQLPQTEPKLLEQALTAAIAIQNEWPRSVALAAIAPQLPQTEPKLLEQALTAAIAIQDESYRSRALAAIAPQLPQTEPKLLEQALTAASTIQYNSYRDDALAAIAPQLPQTEPKLLEQALTAAAAIQNESYRSRALAAIAPQLPQTEPKLLEQALTAASTIQDEEPRSRALAALAPQLPQTEPKLLEQALTAAAAIQNESYRYSALAAIAPQLPQTEPKLLEQALTAAIAFQDKQHYRSRALAAIAPQLPQTEPKLLEQALTAAIAIQDESFRSRALAAIAPQLPQTYLPQLLAATSGLSKEDAAQVLTSPAVRFTEALAVQFPRDKHLVALEVVKVLPQDTDKTKFLSALAPQLSVGLLPSALRLIQDVFTQDADRAEAFSNLIPYLSNNQLPEALKLIAQSIKTPHHYTTALENLIPCLSLANFSAILNGLSHDTKNSSGEKAEPEAEPKRILEPKLQARILRAGVASLATTQSIPELSQSLMPAELGVDLAPQAKQVELSELIKTILRLTEQLKTYQSESFSYEKEAATILNQLAPTLLHIPKDEQENIVKLVFASVYQFTDISYQAQILSKWIPYSFKDAEPFLETCKGDDYRALLNIQVRAALFDQFNIQAIDEILKTIQSPFRKAAALVESAGSSYQTEALQAIGGLNNTYLKIQYLQHLIPCLSDIQRLEAARIIREISDQYDKVKALVTLSCKFPEFRSETRQEANGLETHSRVQCIEQLSFLAVEVPEILPSIIEIARKAQLSESASDEEKRQIQLERPQILVALAPHLPMRINREVNRERGSGRPISDDLWERALYLLARGYRDALQGGSLRNESAQDKDFLNLQDEVNALADLLLMRDLEPPMTVGILGGWGGGKSYIMHLMQTHMTEVRSRPVAEAEAWNPDPKNEKLSPYVGHIYQIKFDAWTFAKSDLWASLMQTIFFELNRQISLEQELRAFFEEKGIDPYAENSSYAGIWQVLYKSSEEDRKYFLQNVLKLEDLGQLKQGDKIQNRLNTAENLLWGKFGETKAESLTQLKTKRSELQTTETTLTEKRNDLEQKKQELEKAHQDRQQGFAQQFQKVPKNKLEEVIQKTLGVSGLVLKKRLGQKAFADLQQKIIQQLPEDVDRDDLQTFGTELREAVAKVLEGNEEGTSFQFSWQSVKQWGSTNLTFLAVFMLFAIASVLLPILVAKFNPSALVPQIVAFITPLLPAIAMSQKLWRSAQKWHNQARQALQDYEKQIEIDSQRFVERETKKWLKDSLTQDPQQATADLESAIQTLESQKQQLETEIQAVEKDLPENLPSSLADYVANRIQAGTYDKQLGLMHQVKQDLTNLSGRLLPPSGGSVTTEEFKQRIEDLKEIFPRGLARVVVYIDDLDRCPPDRVVQVLEAVQLLVKTPLFIAVLAVDERYITRALEKFYEGVLSRRGRPSGTDYLEKIIQLPYRVRPIMANTLESYLRSQVVIQDSATGGAKFSEFSRQEFNMLLACCQQVDLSPRTLKRLTNVYKLFKIVCRTRGTKPSPQTQQAILALLALSGRYPSLMRGIFDTIETCFEEQRTAEKAEKPLQTLHLRSPLRDFFKHYQLPEGDRYLQREFEKLKHDALQTEILPRTLTLENMTHEIFNLIRSFSFVGEIGEDPEDYRISNPIVDDPSTKDKPINGSKDG